MLIPFNFIGIRLIRVMQYTVTMFLVDVSSSMGKMREIEVSRPNGETDIIEMTNLEWSLQFVKLKIQEMVCSLSLAPPPHVVRSNTNLIQVYNGRKTDQCAVVLFGSEGAQCVICLTILSHVHTRDR